MNSGFDIKHTDSVTEAADHWQRISKGGKTFETDPSSFITMLTAANEQSEGCVVLYDNASVRHEGKRTLVFGNMHLPDQYEVFDLLMKAASAYAKSIGYQYLLGPINGNTWNNYRLPLDNFGSQFLSDLDYPSYYQEFLRSAGFVVTEEYYSSLSEVFYAPIDPSLVKQMEDEEIKIRNISLDQYQLELEKIFQFCQQVFTNNVFFSPVDKETFISKYLSFRKFIDTDFVLLAEDKNGKLRAIYFVLPDVVTEKRLVIKTIARSPEEKIKGIMMVMSQQVYNKAHEKGYEDIVHAFMHSSNRSRKLSERFSGKPFKTYGLFMKKLHG